MEGSGGTSQKDLNRQTAMGKEFQARGAASTKALRLIASFWSFSDGYTETIMKPSARVQSTEFNGSSLALQYKQQKRTSSDQAVTPLISKKRVIPSGWSKTFETCPDVPTQVKLHSGHFPGRPLVKNLHCNAEDAGSTPGLG